MSWRNSRATLQLRDELNALFPKRSKLSDGTIGNAAHASRTSDHNPWVRDISGVTAGIVTAIDLTDDDFIGADMRVLTQWLVRESQDPRIKYIISEGKIYSSYKTTQYPAWAARPYSGPNGHFKHLHVSVLPEPYLYDDGSPWGIAAAFAPPTPRPAPGRPPLPTTPGIPVSNWSEKLVRNLPTLEAGDNGLDVRRLQGLLIAAGVVGSNRATYIDGDFGRSTLSDVREFQSRKRLVVDGEVGPKTWTALLD